MSTKSIPLTSYQIRLLAVLALINFVNFAARQVFVPLIPLLRDHLHATDAQLGSLQTFLLVVLAVGSIPFGFLADRFSRKAIIAIGILLWSIATFAGGLVSTFLFFLIVRAMVGLGEAAYAPAAQSMISGGFPQERRAFAQSIFASGMLLGGAAGQALGGIIGLRYGWEAALFIVAFAGIVPGIALFWIDEPPRGPRSDVVPIARLLRVPAFVTMIAAGTCITFASVSLLTWGTDFAVNYKDFSLREASVSLALIALLSLVCGVLMGGWIADQLQKHLAYGRIIAVAIAFLLAAPFLLTPLPSASTCLPRNWWAALALKWSARSLISTTCSSVCKSPSLSWFAALCLCSSSFTSFAATASAILRSPLSTPNPATDSAVWQPGRRFRIRTHSRKLIIERRS